jgi:hypothetical protein
MSLPEQFFSFETFGSVTGSAVVVVVVANSLRYFLGFRQKWMLLLVSFVVVLTISTQATEPNMAMRLFLIVANSCLLAMTAVGLNETAGRGGEEVKAKEFGAKPRKFFDSWFG